MESDLTVSVIATVTEEPTETEEIPESEDIPEPEAPEIPEKNYPTHDELKKLIATKLKSSMKYKSAVTWVDFNGYLPEDLLKQLTDKGYEVEYTYKSGAVGIESNLTITNPKLKTGDPTKDMTGLFTKMFTSYINKASSTY